MEVFLNLTFIWNNLFSNSLKFLFASKILVFRQISILKYENMLLKIDSKVAFPRKNVITSYGKDCSQFIKKYLFFQFYALPNHISYRTNQEDMQKVFFFQFMLKEIVVLPLKQYYQGESYVKAHIWSVTSYSI